MILGMITMSLLSGILVTLTGYYTPFMLVSPVLSSLDALEPYRDLNESLLGALAHRDFFRICAYIEHDCHADWVLYTVYARIPSVIICRRRASLDASSGFGPFHREGHNTRLCRGHVLDALEPYRDLNESLLGALAHRDLS
jgi:hypothetical protein